MSILILVGLLSHCMNSTACHSDYDKMDVKKRGDHVDLPNNIKEPNSVAEPGTSIITEEDRFG